MTSSLSKGLLLVVLIAAVCDGQKLHVGIYYESLCSDSIRFITQQLYPAYEDFKNYVDLYFVPFGKSSSFNGGKMFRCQHGPNECYGNMIQSCTLHALNGNPDASMEYVACQMGWYVDPTGQECAAKVGVHYDQVVQCFNGDLGTRLQLGAEKATHEIAYPYPRFVPTMVFNKRFDQRLQNRSLTDFKGVVCELINNAAPVCKR